MPKKEIEEYFEDVSKGLLVGDTAKLAETFPNEDEYNRIIKITSEYLTDNNINFNFNSEYRYWDDLVKFRFTFMVPGQFIYSVFPPIIIALLDELGHPYTNKKSECKFKVGNVPVRIEAVMGNSEGTTVIFYTQISDKKSIIQRFYDYRLDEKDADKLRIIWNSGVLKSLIKGESK